MFELLSEYAPAGDQPQAIAKLTEGVLSGAPQWITDRCFPALKNKRLLPNSD